MKTRHCSLAIVFALLFSLILFTVCGCNQNDPEAITIYPSYYNRDVEGIDAQFICSALEQAGWHLAGSIDADDYISYSYLSKKHTNEQKYMIIICEYSSAVEAEQAYITDGNFDYILSSNFFLEKAWFTSHLRISNCVITTLGNAQVELLDLLSLSTVEPLEATAKNTREMCRDCKSVDIEAIRADMEADGYQFYAAGFTSRNDEDDGYTQAYIIISPEQDRMYAYTGCGEKPVMGIPSAYKAMTDYLAWNNSLTAGIVGVHVVGFKDGSNVLCYGDSFEEIRAYFVQ